MKSFAFRAVFKKNNYISSLYPIWKYSRIFSVYVYHLFFSGNGKLASFGAIFGFVVMMSLDVGLG